MSSLSLGVYIVTFVLGICVLSLTLDAWILSRFNISSTPMKASIPKQILQTSKSGLPPHIKPLVLKQVQGWNYRHFTDAECDAYISSSQVAALHFPSLLYVFRRLKGAHRADVFRYLWLYEHGGVFLDSDLMLYSPLDDIVEDQSFVSCLDAQDRSVFTGFLGCAPGHPILFAALQAVVATPTVLLTQFKAPWLRPLNVYTYTIYIRQMKRIVDAYQSHDGATVKLLREVLHDEAGTYSVLREQGCANKTVVAIHYHKFKDVPYFQPDISNLEDPCK